MAAKIYKEKSVCDTVDCPFYAWKKTENKVCIKTTNDICPLSKKEK